VGKHLLSKCQALSSITSTEKENNVRLECMKLLKENTEKTFQDIEVSKDLFGQVTPITGNKCKNRQMGLHEL
jgi:hypothetical protein